MTMFFDAEDEIVIRELQRTYVRESSAEKIDCSDDWIEPDFELLRSIEKVLGYYMDSSSYKEWRKQYVSD